MPHKKVGTLVHLGPVQLPTEKSFGSVIGYFSHIQVEFEGISFFLFLLLLYFTSFREQDESYTNSLRWSTLVGLEPSYTRIWVAHSTTELWTSTEAYLEKIVEGDLEKLLTTSKMNTNGWAWCFRMILMFFRVPCCQDTYLQTWLNYIRQAPLRIYKTLV